MAINYEANPEVWTAQGAPDLSMLMLTTGMWLYQGKNADIVEPMLVLARRSERQLMTAGREALFSPNSGLCDSLEETLRREAIDPRAKDEHVGLLKPFRVTDIHARVLTIGIEWCSDDDNMQHMYELALNRKDRNQESIVGSKRFEEMEKRAWARLGIDPADELGHMAKLHGIANIILADTIQPVRDSLPPPRTIVRDTGKTVGSGVVNFFRGVNQGRKANRQGRLGDK